MRVLFVFPDLSSTVTGYTGVVHNGVALLSASLKQAGHATALLHLTHEPDEEDFRARVRAAKPDLVAFTAISNYAQRLRRWTTWAHEASGAPIAVGGVHATYATEEVAAHPHVHFTCVGEGEQALLELCEALERGRDPGSIPNLWVRRGDTIVRNPMRTIVDDLDTLPDPDYELFDVPALYNSRAGVFGFLMSRGCAFKCTYCAAHTLRKLAPREGKFWCFLTPRRAVDQLRGLIDRTLPQTKLVSFNDAIFFPTKDWLREFATLYRERVGLPVSCNMRADMVDEESAALLASIGTKVVRLGVESGNEHLTRDVLKRHLGVEDLRRGYRILREAGIERWSYNIVGLPTETLPMALETVKLNAEIDPELALAFIFYPYPGTELHRLSRELGFLTDREFDTYKVGVALRQPQFADGDVLFVHRYFDRLIRTYRAARRMPGRLAALSTAALDAALTSPLLPRGGIVRGSEAYRELRHAVGEYLHGRSPALYKMLGGRAPAPASSSSREGVARANA